MSGHTLGRWIVVEYSSVEEAREDGAFEWAGASDFGAVGAVYQTTPGGGYTGLPGNIETTLANARLIAAAPDLLEALTEAERLLEHMGNVLNGMDCVDEEDEAMATPIFEAVRAAIARATGEV